ncbi:endonuclease/exonuclease/phosphatase family protein [Proteiniphilum propionicum]|uniref:endonuclease/exonuclease/phosphatase family protein n=1 Tax=Proteiniphilum propionicum TaxID=2829812 RepID=UPI001EEC45D2|nr:endonuclease/exonuclease/phosphatase family protein [Proteiniphilum propionicum]ULB33473.1 endonuclease/exonuclease/phosphatase family protein [Proteiniphilum propionicum]
MSSNKISLFFVTFLSIIPFLACGKSKVAEITFLELTHNEVVFWPEAGEKIVEVRSNANFTVESTDSWCKAEIIPENSNKIRISVEMNKEIGKERSSELTVRVKELVRNIKVKQLSETPQATVSQTQIYFNENQTLEFCFDISSNLSYSMELPQWIVEKESEVIDKWVKRHHFVASALNRSDSKRDGTVVVRFNGHSDVKDIVVPVKQSNEYSRFSSGSYNLLVGGWPDRRELVYTIVNHYDFDIWGTQEGTKVHLTDIVNQFKKYHYTGTGRDGGDNGEFYAIFYKTDRFELLDEGSFWFSNTPEKPSYGWDAVNYRRICSWGKFRDRETYNVFYFFNSHFDHQGAVARVESAKLLLSKIKEIVKNQYTFFASGDFNCQPGSEPISILKAYGQLYDARDLAEEPLGPEGTFNQLKPFEASKNRIDYIFVSKNVKLLQYRVIDDRPYGRCPSDHDPVLIVTEF